jgi:hypothetical protein
VYTRNGKNTDYDIIEYEEVIFVYTQRSGYSCTLVSIDVLNMNILVVVPVGYFGGNPN